MGTAGNWGCQDQHPPSIQVPASRLHFRLLCTPEFCARTSLERSEVSMSAEELQTRQSGPTPTSQSGKYTRAEEVACPRPPGQRLRTDRGRRRARSSQHTLHGPPWPSMVNVLSVPQVDPLRVVQPPHVCPGPVQPAGESVFPRQQPLVPGRGLHAAGLHHRPSRLIYALRQRRLVRSRAEKGPWGRPHGTGHTGRPRGPCSWRHTAASVGRNRHPSDGLSSLPST